MHFCDHSVRGQKMSADAMKIMAFYDEKAVLTKPVGATAKRIRHPPPSCASWFGFLGLVCCVYTCVNGHMAFGNRMWIGTSLGWMVGGLLVISISGVITGNYW